MALLKLNGSTAEIADTKARDDISEINNALYWHDIRSIVFDQASASYDCGNTYYCGFVANEPCYVKTILPSFKTNVETYQYAIYEFPELIRSTQNVVVIKEWTTLNADEPIVVNDYLTVSPYTVILLKAGSKIDCGSNSDYSKIKMVSTQLNGYVNYSGDGVLVPKSTIVIDEKNDNYVKKTEYEQGTSGWKDCNIGIIGDSFTALGNWAQEMGENIGANIYSKAMSAQGFANQSGRSAYKQAQMFVSQNPTVSFDAFIIAMGTNDNNTTITDISDVNNLSDLSTDAISTYTGGMQACIMYLQEHYPNARILLGWTPACGFWSSGTYAEYTTKMDAHVEAMKAVAEWYGVEYIETRPCGFTRKNSAYASYWGSDNHPSALGHHKIAQYMTMLMKSLGGYTAVQTD